MMHQMSKQGYEYGIRLVEALCSGTFPEGKQTKSWT